jgi:alkylation response protein AidB-like acyl-CoA dehydrogenase
MVNTSIREDVIRISEGFAREREARQQRRALDPCDFEALRDAGFLRTAVPADQGGMFESVARSARPICELLRVLARGDSSVALVSSMHPAVLAHWLSTPLVSAELQQRWAEQRSEVFRSARDGCWWGTITSEPGSGGDIGRTKAVAHPAEQGYLLDGQKHFGSGLGVTSFMLTSAVPAGEPDPDWFFLDVRSMPWDGSRGMKLVSEWDGHGMIATQSHGMSFTRFPATRLAWPGHRREISAAAAAFIGCLFSAVVAGVVEIAVETAHTQLLSRSASLGAYERVEWSRAEVEAWLIAQAFEGMLRAVETQPAPNRDILKGKTAIAELAESCLTRICRVMGGGSFGRRSPFGHWFEDVRALGFLRPPWGLAYDSLSALKDG